MAITILNGCSFTANWKSFGSDYSNGVNLSLPGGSNRRSFRTTMEYCATHTVSRVMVGITDTTRFEFPQLEFDDVPVEGPYIQSNRHNGIPLRNSIRKYHLSVDQFWLYEFDNFLMDLIGFAAWLDQQKINYLIWNQSNRFDLNFMQRQFMQKLKYVQNNPRIINLFKFCANEYLDSLGCKFDENDRQYEARSRHFAPEEFVHLKNYLDRQWQ